MPRYRHPRAADDAPGAPPAAVHVSRAERATVDDAGEFDVPAAVAEAIARDHDTTAEAMRVGGTCEAVKSDGEVCGRELPCPYHSEDD